MKNLHLFNKAARAGLIVLCGVGFATTGHANSTGITGASGQDQGFLLPQLSHHRWHYSDGCFRRIDDDGAGCHCDL